MVLDLADLAPLLRPLLIVLGAFAVARLAGALFVGKRSPPTWTPPRVVLLVTASAGAALAAGLWLLGALGDTAALAAAAASAGAVSASRPPPPSRDPR